MLAGEHRSGAAKADCDFVCDQVHAVLIAQFARAGQIHRVVHPHTGCGLHQRLEDQRGGGVGMCDQLGL